MVAVQVCRPKPPFLFFDDEQRANYQSEHPWRLALFKLRVGDTHFVAFIDNVPRQRGKPNAVFVRSYTEENAVAVHLTPDDWNLRWASWETKIRNFSTEEEAKDFLTDLYFCEVSVS